MQYYTIWELCSLYFSNNSKLLISDYKASQGMLWWLFCSLSRFSVPFFADCVAIVNNKNNILMGAFISIFPNQFKVLQGWKLWSLLPKSANVQTITLLFTFKVQDCIYPSVSQYKVHAGSFRVSIIHQTLTWQWQGSNLSHWCHRVLGLMLCTANSVTPN